MVKNELVIPKVWRSEIKMVALFFFFSFLCVIISRSWGWSVLSAPVFTIGGTTIMLTLPIFWFVPFITLMMAVVHIYNVRYSVNSRGVEAKIGILSLNQRVTTVRYEDIRSLETEQTLLDRMLDIGRVEISTAATGSIEIIFAGIAVPEEVQDMLQRERDSRRKQRRGKQKAVYEESVNAEVLRG